VKAIESTDGTLADRFKALSNEIQLDMYPMDADLATLSLRSLKWHPMKVFPKYQDRLFRDRVHSERTKRQSERVSRAAHKIESLTLEEIGLSVDEFLKESQQDQSSARIEAIVNQIICQHTGLSSNLLSSGNYIMSTNLRSKEDLKRAYPELCGFDYIDDLARRTTINYVRGDAVMHRVNSGMVCTVWYKHLPADISHRHIYYRAMVMEEGCVEWRLRICIQKGELRSRRGAASFSEKICSGTGRSLATSPEGPI
jgi:hypothetical protein